jgi:hypothetical protein
LPVISFNAYATEPVETTLIDNWAYHHLLADRTS